MDIYKRPDMGWRSQLAYGLIMVIVMAGFMYLCLTDGTGQALLP